MMKVSLYFSIKKKTPKRFNSCKTSRKNELIKSSNPLQNACNIMYHPTCSHSGYFWLNLFNGNLLLSMENVVEVGVELLVELLVTLDYLPILQPTVVQ